MKRKKALKEKIKKGVILGSIFIGAVFMASAYSLLTRTLTISGTANLYSSDRYLWRQLKNNPPSGLSASTYDSRKMSYTGTNPNNYLSIDGNTWRIVSIENDNTIKIVKLDGIQTGYDLANNRTSVSTYCTNLSNGCNSLTTRSTITNGTIEGLVENNSTVYNSLNIFYNSLSNDFKSKIIEHNFNIGPVEIDNNTTLTNVLSQEINDSYTGYIGLPSLSDFIYATTSTVSSTVSSLTLDNNYLTSSTDTVKWTANPLYDSSTNVWTINRTKNLNSIAAKTQTETESGNSFYYIAIPTVYLKSTVKLVDGTGTYADPFVLE